jgi:tetratricopeptide (TPR) repeat protein
MEPFNPTVEHEPESAEDYYQTGLEHENFDNREQALDAYAKALEINPQHAPTHFRLGLMQLRSANLPSASHHLRQAVSGGLLEANYYAGLTACWEGDLDQAEAFFRSVPAGSSLSAAALRQLGQLALGKQDWQKAVDLFQSSVEDEDRPVAGNLLLGIALRRCGRRTEASHIIDQVLSIDPLNHIALRERRLLLGSQDSGSQDILQRMMADDRQYILDLAGFYQAAGLLDEALQILEQAWQDWPYAMIAYLAANIYDKLGNDEGKEAWLLKGSQASPDYVFPSRLEEVLALEKAIFQNSQDARARYYLGNFYYAHERYDEGVQLWKEALLGLNDFDVLYRNLGLAAWQRGQNLPDAIKYFEQALTLNPQNQDLYLHLDDLYKAQGLIEKRAQLLGAIKAASDVREDVHKHSIVMLVDLGHFAEALDIMERENFVPLEMDQSFHNVYVQALMMRADAHLQEDRLEQAAADYQKALQFPTNLGVGAPTTRSQAHIYYHLGLSYEKLGRFRDALAAWQCAASEHHSHGSELFTFVQKSLDKLSRYSELGLEI